MAATHKMVNGVLVELSPEEAAAIEADWAANPPPTAQQMLDRFRNQVKAALDRQEDESIELLRGVVLTLLDEMNLHAARVNALLNAIDNGATLAQIKTAVAAIADLPVRTAAQVRNTIKDKITAGDAGS